MVFDPSQVNGTNEDTPDDQPGGKYGYRIGHKKGKYQIPDVILDECSKHVKVVTIGAGISGIFLSYLFQKHGENLEHVVYEKNGDIGGTWLENRYPGAACDVPSHAYTFAFALYPDWPKYLSPSEDIFRYLSRVVDCFELRKYMTFNSAVKGCTWDEAQGIWHLKIQDSVTGEVRTDTCNILIGAGGILNSWKFPEDVEGLHSFKGRLLHTARWPDDYGRDEWKDQRVVVIGSGATSMQVVPTMQPHVQKMDVFVRTPVWFAEFADHAGDNFHYSDEDKSILRENADALVNKAKSIEDKLNTPAGLKAFMVNSAEAKMIRKHFTDRMRKYITDDQIFEQLLPDFAVGCRRLTPGNPYMRAVQEENVSIHRCAVTRVTPRSIIGSNGDGVEVDTIICATGFDVSFRPRYPVIGRNGVSLRDKWADVPEGYMSVAVPDMPNYFTVMGPYFPIANGSVMGPLATMESIMYDCLKPTTNSRVLAQNLVKALDRVAPIYVPKEFFEAGTRYVNGDELCDDIGIGKPGLYWMSVVRGLLWLLMAVTYIGRSIPVWDRWQIKFFRNLFWNYIVEGKDGLKGGYKYEFKYIPKLGEQTGVESSGNPPPKEERAMLETLGLGSFILFMLLATVGSSLLLKMLLSALPINPLMAISIVKH